MLPSSVPLLEELYLLSLRLIVSATMFPVLVQVAPPLALRSAVPSAPTTHTDEPRWSTE